MTKQRKMRIVPKSWWEDWRIEYNPINKNIKLELPNTWKSETGGSRVMTITANEPTAAELMSLLESALIQLEMNRTWWGRLKGFYGKVNRKS